MGFFGRLVERIRPPGNGHKVKRNHRSSARGPLFAEEEDDSRPRGALGMFTACFGFVVRPFGRPRDTGPIPVAMKRTGGGDWERIWDSKQVNPAEDNVKNGFYAALGKKQGELEQVKEHLKILPKTPGNESARRKLMQKAQGLLGNVKTINEAIEKIENLEMGKDSMAITAASLDVTSKMSKQLKGMMKNVSVDKVDRVNEEFTEVMDDATELIKVAGESSGVTLGGTFDEDELMEELGLNEGEDNTEFDQTFIDALMASTTEDPRQSGQYSSGEDEGLGIEFDSNKHSGKEKSALFKKAFGTSSKPGEKVKLMASA